MSSSSLLVNTGPALRSVNPKSQRDGAALAAHNTRLVLADRYRDTVFEVRVHRARRAVALRVTWLLDEAGPTEQQVRIAIARFVKLDPSPLMGLGSPGKPDRIPGVLDQTSNLFQGLFGAVDRLDLQPLTLEQAIAREHEVLRRTMDGMGSQGATPTGRRPRSRL